MTQPVSTHSWLLVSLSGLTFEEGKINQHLAPTSGTSCCVLLSFSVNILRYFNLRLCSLQSTENSSSLFAHYMSKESSSSPVTVHTASLFCCSNLNPWRTISDPGLIMVFIAVLILDFSVPETLQTA